MSLIKKMLYQYFDPFCPDRDSFSREKKLIRNYIAQKT